MRQYTQAYLDVFGSGLVSDAVVRKHIEQQATIDKILPDSASFFYVVEAPTKKYHFMGKQQESVSGYSNQEFLERGIDLFFQCLHPEEIEIILGRVYPDAMQFVSSTEYEEKRNLVMQYNYRFKRKSGAFINLMEQIYILEVDAQGMAALLLGNIIILGGSEVLPLRLSVKYYRNNSISETIFSRVYTNKESAIDAVTNRERDILRNLAAGKTSKEIAQQLFISPHTVDTHRRNLLNKLNCKSVVELAQFAFKNGML